MNTLLEIVGIVVLVLDLVGVCAIAAVLLATHMFNDD